MSNLHRDDEDLAGFGYRRRLHRTLGGFSSFAAGFSYLSILTGLPQLFYLGFGAGGPAFFWTWPMVFAGQFLVALCFAEMAAEFPLSGGVYQWSRRVGADSVGWLAGWVYLASAVITLASVALAPQSTLPQISSVFQVIGQPGNRLDAARNAVFLGCVLIVFSTIVNAVGVKLLARLNNIGVFAELAGAIILLILLNLHGVRGVDVVFETQSRGTGHSLGYLGAFLAAALTPSFVMYGFDTAGSLAEETSNPRRRAPRAILGSLGAVGLVGALLILGALRSTPDILDPALGRISGGMPYVIKSVLGETVGTTLLWFVAVAVVVCTLTVQAAAVRLVFSMARDRNLPFSELLAKVSITTRTPVWPSVLLGLAAVLLLIANANAPELVETLVSVAIVWANLGYLLVTAPMLVRRLRSRSMPRQQPPGGFSMGLWGLPVNILAVLWGLFVILNIGWPRPEIYGSSSPGRFAAPLATSVMLILGILYYHLFQKRKTGILDDHRAD